MELQVAEQVVVPFIVTQGLEADAYCLRVVDKEWCVVQKLADMDLPTCIADVKEGKIPLYINQLQQIKVCTKRHGSLCL